MLREATTIFMPVHREGEQRLVCARNIDLRTSISRDVKIADLNRHPHGVADEVLLGENDSKTSQTGILVKHVLAKLKRPCLDVCRVSI